MVSDTMVADSQGSLHNKTLIDILHERFSANMDRHSALKWADVFKRLKDNRPKLLVLHNMEETGGEPDVTGFDEVTGEFIFMDCVAETPVYRRNVCYDRDSQDARKGEGKPAGNAVDMAADIGIELLTEKEYKALQKLGEFDKKTSSWVKTPPEIRALGGALFCDRRYDHVFVYHNGASSYYSTRGFRGRINV